MDEWMNGDGTVTRYIPEIGKMEVLSADGDVIEALKPATAEVVARHAELFPAPAEIIEEPGLPGGGVAAEVGGGIGVGGVDVEPVTPDPADPSRAGMLALIEQTIALRQDLQALNAKVDAHIAEHP